MKAAPGPRVTAAASVAADTGAFSSETTECV